jgi:hypothetical protein
MPFSISGHSRASGKGFAVLLFHALVSVVWHETVRLTEPGIPLMMNKLGFGVRRPAATEANMVAD